MEVIERREVRGDLTVGMALATHAMLAALNPAFTPSTMTQNARRLQISTVC